MMKNKTNVKWKKRAATIVMSLCLLMGLMPIKVFAAGSSEELPVYTIESAADTDYVEREGLKATFTSDTAFTINESNEYNRVSLDYYYTNLDNNPDEGFDILVGFCISLKFTNPTDSSISGEITIPLPSGYDGATAKIRNGATAISSTETTVTFPVTLEVAGGSTFTELYVEYKEKPQCTHSYDNDADTTCNLCGYVRTVTAPKPSITGGKNEKWTQGSSKELVFTSNAPLSEFVSVTIDGQVVDEKYYVKEEGSTIIKLKADYLSTLSAGKHTISINSTSGSATTAFTIEKTKSPDTGDNNNLFLWTAMLCVSGFAIFGIRIYSKKEKTIE